MNPAPRLALVLGKWGAVASVGVMIAVLSCLSFLPGQWLLRSETLAALFQFGLREALAFIALPLYVLLPHHYAERHAVPLAALGLLGAFGALRRRHKA